MRHYGEAPGHLDNVRAAEVWSGMDIDSDNVGEDGTNLDTIPHEMRDFSEGEFEDYNFVEGNGIGGGWEDNNNDASPLDSLDDDEEEERLAVESEDSETVDDADSDDDGYASM